MIRNDKGYRDAVQRIAEDEKYIVQQRAALEDADLTSDQIEYGMQPTLSFHAQLREEVEWYERARRRDFKVFDGLTGVGRLLIAARIANGMTQAELARKLGVDESQVARDERNEYHGITIERAERISQALNETFTVGLKWRPLPTATPATKHRRRKVGTLRALPSN